MKKNIVITILAILVLGLGGYLVYDKVLSSDDNEIENNEVKEESYDLIAAKKLIDKYYYENLSLTTFSKGYTDDSMKFLAMQNVGIKDSSTVYCSSIYSEDDLDLSGYYYTVSFNNGELGYCQAKGTTQQINYDAFLESYHNLFGNDKQISKEGFSFGGARYDYNEKTNSFIKLDCNCGGAYTGFRIYGVQNAKIINGKLIINVGMSEFTMSSTENSGFKTVVLNEELNFSDNEIFDNNHKIDSFEQQFLSQYLDKMDTYTFTFFEENGIYKLESMVKA